MFWICVGSIIDISASATRDEYLYGMLVLIIKDCFGKDIVFSRDLNSY